MPSQNNEYSIKKLILLFVFDKMEDSLTKRTVLDICYTTNHWLEYMECIDLLDKLLYDGFIVKISEEDDDSLYALTPDGRESLANFYITIPKSIREEISIFAKKNIARFRNRQECRSDYYQNRDGTYTVSLKIISSIQPILELKLVVPDKKTASQIYKKWEEKAADVYGVIYENLVD